MSGRSGKYRRREAPLAALAPPLTALGRTASPGAAGPYLNPLVSVVPLAEIRVKVVEEVLFPASAVVSIECKIMKCRISIPPQFYPLDSAQTPDVAVRVCPAVGVRPDHVGVEPVDQISPPNVALQLDGPLDGRELVLDFDVLIVHYAVGGGVPNAMGLLEGEVELHFPRIAEPAVLGMQCVGE